MRLPAADESGRRARLVAAGVRVDLVDGDIDDRELAVAGRSHVPPRRDRPRRSPMRSARRASLFVAWPLILITGTGPRLIRQHAGKLINRLGEQIGVPHLQPHQPRHAFVTLSLDEGASLRNVLDAARHAAPRTTRRYDRSRNSLSRPTHRLLGALEP
jgi:integrase